MVDPLPTPEFLESFYSGDYYEPWRGQEADRDRLWRRRLHLLKDVPRGRLLDVGCAEGDFLQHAIGAGFNGTGTEFSEWGAGETARKLGIDVHAGELYTLDLPQNSFDIITLWHVLEHTTQPGQVLEAAHRFLKPGGTLIVAVPNRSSPLFRLFYQMARRRPLLLYQADDREQHLFHWSPEALRTAVTRHHFDVRSVRPDPCAVGRAKSLVDLLGRLHSSLTGAPRTNAMMLLAFKEL